MAFGKSSESRVSRMKAQLNLPNVLQKNKIYIKQQIINYVKDGYVVEVYVPTTSSSSSSSQRKPKADLA